MLVERSHSLGIVVALSVERRSRGGSEARGGCGCSSGKAFLRGQRTRAYRASGIDTPATTHRRPRACRDRRWRPLLFSSMFIVDRDAPA